MIYAFSRWKDGKKSGEEEEEVETGEGSNESEGEDESARFFGAAQRTDLCCQDFAIR